MSTNLCMSQRYQQSLRNAPITCLILFHLIVISIPRARMGNKKAIGKQIGNKIKISHSDARIPASLHQTTRMQHASLLAAIV